MPLLIGVRLEGDLPGANDLGDVSWKPKPRAAVSLPAGVVAGAADVVFADTRTLAASGSDNIDLNGTTFFNVLGAALALVKVKALYIKAAEANSNNLVIGNGTNPFVGPFSAGTVTVTLPPGGELLLTAPSAGWAVTAATADILKIANSAGGSTVDYDIVIVGTSA